MAQRRDFGDEYQYYLHTTDGGVLRVTEDSYERVLAWMETHE